MTDDAWRHESQTVSIQNLLRERDEARASEATLRAALEEAAARMLGLASTWHHDDSLQGELIARALETRAYLRPFWHNYINRVCELKPAVAARVEMARRALRESESVSGASEPVEKEGE